MVTIIFPSINEIPCLQNDYNICRNIGILMYFWLFVFWSLILFFFCRHAAGMLWNGEAREVKELEENMEAYFNVLHGFLLTCHGSTVIAGPTLHESIRTSAKQVVDCSLSLLREAASNYGEHLFLYLKLLCNVCVHSHEKFENLNPTFLTLQLSSNI